MSCGIALFTPEGTFALPIPCVWFADLVQDGFRVLLGLWGGS